MTVRRALVSVAGLATLAFAGCSVTTPGNSTAAAGSAPDRATFPPTGIAVMIGNSATSNTKFADVFDTTAHALLGRFSAAAPGPHTRLGPIVTAADGRHVFVTAYDSVSPSVTHSGVYDVDLATQTARYFKSLGSGTPVDATMAGSMLQVIVSDQSTSDPRQANRVVSIDTATGSVEHSANPMPLGADGKEPIPTSIVFDRSRKLTYVTDISGAIYAFFPDMRFFRKLPGVLPLFSANGASVAFDEHRSVLYQLGIFSSVDDRQRQVAYGALLATQITTGATHLSTFPYLPVSGVLLDRAGSTIYFGSTFAPEPGKFYVSRVDIGTTHYVSRPISFGLPEFVYTGKLAFSNDGSHLIMPVSTGADATLAGAMLEFDPGSLTLQSSAVSPDSFESGGVVSM